MGAGSADCRSSKRIHRCTHKVSTFDNQDFKFSNKSYSGTYVKGAALSRILTTR
jgi:hypothetical protein